jgi:hypothetical protein
MLRLYLRCLTYLLNPKAHYRGQNILPLDTALSKMHLVQSQLTCLTLTLMIIYPSINEQKSQLCLPFKVSHCSLAQGRTKDWGDGRCRAAAYPQIEI